MSQKLNVPTNNRLDTYDTYSGRNSQLRGNDYMTIEYDDASEINETLLGEKQLCTNQNLNGDIY